MLADSAVADFARAVSSKEPTPGGGSVSAAAGAIGAALGAMAARFSDDEETATSLDEVRDELLKMVDEDAAAYGGVSSALALPKGTDEEKKSRKRQLQAALAAAADVPLRGMEAGVRALEALARLAPRCNKYLVSDLRTSAGVLFASITGCGEFVRVNAGPPTDKEAGKRLLDEADRLSAEAARLRDAVMKPPGAK